MPGDIWIGDLVKALALVDPEDDMALNTVVRLLGFKPAGVLSQAPGASDSVPSSRIEAAETSEACLATDSDLEVRTGAPDDRPAAVEEGGETSGLRQLRPIGYEPMSDTEWTVEPLPRPVPGRREEPLPYQPLFAPCSTSSILQIALSTHTSDGEPDIAETVRRLATCNPLTELFVRPARTLRFGVQVLVDLGVGMEPFARDQQELIRQIRDTVGQELTDIRYFDGSPLRGAGDGDRGEWSAYKVPARGTRVLLLSDLGLGGPSQQLRRADAAEWREWVSRLATARCSAAAFVPYPPSRWPGWARDLLHLVAWDRRTTAGRAGRRPPPEVVTDTAA